MENLEIQTSKLKNNSLKNLDKHQFRVIKRDEIKGINSLKLEEVETYLGELRNFKNHNYINEFLPEDISIGWVSLPKGKTLKPHYHPCSSMIIVTKGQGVSLGDSQIEFSEGDIIHIPAWNLHGFCGAGLSGFEGLSIQFQDAPIFGSEDCPETTYIDRELIPLRERELVKISREKIKSLNSVTTETGNKNLGIVKNFRSNSFIDKLLPDFFSAAWVHLEEGEELSLHEHNEKSLILITHGEGIALGADEEIPLKTGDGVFVPENASHGFKGKNGGFWGLSIQFEPNSLYEDPTRPRVKFVNNFEKLKAFNDKKYQKLSQLDIFKIPKEEFIDKPELKSMLLDCLQVISDNFQKLMFARVALTQDIKYNAVFMEHLIEELNHDNELRQERGKGRVKLWDPILEASTSWFNYQNHIVDDPKRVLMVSMVLEKCATQFYGHFASILGDSLRSEHIESHCEADPHHENLGLDLIEKVCEYRLEEFTDFINKAWSMMYLYINRKGELVNQCRLN